MVKTNQQETLTVKRIASFLKGQIVGDPETPIHGVASVEEAREGDLTFALTEEYLAQAEKSGASAILVPKSVVDSESEKVLIRVDLPRFAFAKVLSLFESHKKGEGGIHPSAVIHPEAQVDPSALVMANVTVEAGAAVGAGSVLYPGVFVGEKGTIGRDCVLHANVNIYGGCRLGDRVIIHAGTVIGSDGFGFVEHEGKHYKVPQIGRVTIEDDVEIGSNCSIDRATTGSTLIKSGTKIDNLVHVAHNVVIGHDCLLVAQVGVSGSVEIGNHVTLAGQVGVAGHITIGDNTVVAAKSGVTKPIPSNLYVSGFPAKPHSEEKRIKVSLLRLPDLLKKTGNLVKAVQRLTRRIEMLESNQKRF